MFLKLCLFLLFLSSVKCHGYEGSWSSGYSRFRTPQDTMVDVVNNLALKLLAIHNEGNDNNIAISPYGALSVLVALKEGVRGEAANEIHRASGIPSDLSTIRIGLRDIHRHLKSYFIPDEGFLSGLTLSHDNVTLHREYEDILRFYGFDIDSFNNALDPDSSTTENPTSTTEIPTSTIEIGTSTADLLTATTEESVSTTEKMLEKEIATIPTTTEIMSTTTDNAKTTRLQATITATATTNSENISTTAEMATVPTTTEIMSTTTDNARTTRSQETPTATTNSESMPTTTEMPMSTITTTTRSTTIPLKDIKKATVITKTETTTVGDTETTSVTKMTESSTEAQTMTSESSTTQTNIELSSIRTTTIENSASTETISSMTSESSTMPTTETSTELPSTRTETTEISSTSESMTSESSTETVTEQSSTSTATSESSTTTESISSTENTSTETSSETKETSGSTTEELMSSTLSSGQNDASEDETEANSTILKESPTNTVELNGEIVKNSDSDESKKNYTLRRDTRSVVDYIIARYYDDHAITQRPPPYNAENDLYFLINGKYKESNINYMTYDTVLPFYYVSHLNTLALRFPLDSSKYYLLLLLPEDPQQINKLICDLRLNSSLKYITDNLRYTHVKAIIPSFMLKGYAILTPTFQKMGINRVFEPRQADFSPMTTNRGLYVTNIEQAITVNIRNYVDPDTMNNNRYLHRSNPVLFKADHPFIYFVIDSQIDVTLMAGKIVNPLNSRIR